MTRTYSAREVLRHKDFAEFTPQEVDSRGADARGPRMARGQPQVQALGSPQAKAPPSTSARPSGAASATAANCFDLPRLARKEKPRRLTLICDVSGSMERYTRMLLHFIHSLADSWDRVEAFLFATRLTRVTDRLAHRGVDDAIAEVARTVPDWAGGTRIGDSIMAFNYLWSRRVLRLGLRRPHHLRRLGQRRARSPWPRGRQAPEKLPPPDMAEPPPRLGNLRAPHQGDAGSPALRRRPPAGA